MDPQNSQVSTTPVVAPPIDGRPFNATGAEPCQSTHTSQGDVLAFLSDPQSYGHEGPVDQVDLEQCTLFMIGSFCYKLRKHTPLGQSESLSLRQRYHLACQEVRLGKLFAPDLYIDLVPIQSHQNGLFLSQSNSAEACNGTDAIHSKPEQNTDVVEWLVRLNRFDFSKNFNKQVEIFQPNFADCKRLTGLIGQKPDDTQWYAPVQSWLSHLDEMLNSFGPVVRQLDRQEKQTTLRACLNHAHEHFQRARPLIGERGARSLIGQIHGNVKLDNVVELPEGLRLVNPQVSHNGVFVREWIGDPLYDLASLIDEFWARGLTRQANWVFSHYCNRILESHALEGLELLDLYQFVRAMDRAKSLSSDLMQPDGSLKHLDEKCGKTIALRGFVKTARECLLKDETTVIVVGGSSQANRSHLARLLAPETGRMPGALYLSAEQEMLALHEVETKQELPLSAHRQSVWNLVYRRLADKARTAVSAGYSVVLEGRFDNPLSRQNLSRLSRELGPEQQFIAFHLFDPRQDKRKISSDTEEPHALDLELQAKSPRSSARERVSAEYRHVAPILSSRNADQDWTQWIELDTSRSVGDLLGSALGHINPAWTPKTQETLH